MIKKIFYLSFLLVFFGCEPKIENNKRVIIQGYIVDENNQPVSDIEVESYVEENLIGFGSSNQEGYFRATNLEVFHSGYEIKINKNLSKNYSSIFIERDEDNFEASEVYNLGTLQLKSFSNVTVKVTKTSTENHQLSLRFIFSDANCRLIFENNNSFQNSVCNYNFVFQNINVPTDEPNYNINFRPIKNQVVEVIKEIDNVVTDTIYFTPNSENFDYEITY